MRKRSWPEAIVLEIKRLREEHPNLGKDKIHLLLEPFGEKNKLSCPSISTIGNLIRDFGGLRAHFALEWGYHLGLRLYCTRLHIDKTHFLWYNRNRKYKNFAFWTQRRYISKKIFCSSTHPLQVMSEKEEILLKGFFLRFGMTPI